MKENKSLKMADTMSAKAESNHERNGDHLVEGTLTLKTLFNFNHLLLCIYKSSVIPAANEEVLAPESFRYVDS